MLEMERRRQDTLSISEVGKGNKPIGHLEAGKFAALPTRGNSFWGPLFFTSYLVLISWYLEPSFLLILPFDAWLSRTRSVKGSEAGLGCSGWRPMACMAFTTPRPWKDIATRVAISRHVLWYRSCSERWDVYRDFHRCGCGFLMKCQIIPNLTLHFKADTWFYGNQER